METAPTHAEILKEKSSTAAGAINLSIVGIAYMCDDKPWLSITETKSAVYMMNSIGPNTDPCGTPHISATIVDLASSRRTYYDRPSRYDWNHWSATSWIPKDTCRRCSKISWWTLSKAAVKSSKIKAAKSPRSIASKMSESTCNTAVSVE